MTPLREKARGAVLVPENVAWNPTPTVVPETMRALWVTFRTVTAAPLWADVPFQRFVIFWVPENPKVSAHPSTVVVEVFRIVISAVNPPVHWLVTR